MQHLYFKLCQGLGGDGSPFSGVGGEKTSNSLLQLRLIVRAESSKGTHKVQLKTSLE